MLPNIAGEGKGISSLSPELLAQLSFMQALALEHKVKEKVAFSFRLKAMRASCCYRTKI